MWKTTNYKGEAVTWYSEEDVKPFLDRILTLADFDNFDTFDRKNQQKISKIFCQNFMEFL